MKWALGAVTLIAVIAVAVAVTLAFTHRGPDDGPTNKGNPPTTSGIASANDTGPVSVITDEPTCDKFVPINYGFANQAENGWDDRDPAVPATEWTPDQRTQFEAMGNTMRNMADQFVPLAKQTPHRVVREIYEQFIAYARAYADSIPTYTASDDQLALVAVKASSAMYAACTAISQGSASAWGPSVAELAAPSKTATPSNPANPERFLAVREPVCDDWTPLATQYNADIRPWTEIDSRIPATQWTPEQKAVIDAVKPVMSTYADNVEKLGRRSNNSVVQDFAFLSAVYTRGYIRGLSTYVPSDSFLSAAANYSKEIINQACLAVRG